MLARLALGFTYCKMAETALLDHRTDLARALVQRTQRIGRHVQSHLNLPDYVPAITVAEVRHKLEQLEVDVLAVAKHLTANRNG